MKHTKAAVNFFASVYRAEENPSQKDPFFAATTGMHTPVWHISNAYAWTEELSQNPFVFDEDNVTGVYKGAITSTGSLLSAVLVAPAGGTIAGTNQLNGVIIRNTGSVNLNVVLAPGANSVTLATIEPGKRFSLLGDSEGGPALSTVQIIAASGTGAVEVLATVIPTT